MYGKWVALELGEDVKVSVFVWCTPKTSAKDLVWLATQKLSVLVDEEVEKHV